MSWLITGDGRCHGYSNICLAACGDNSQCADPCPICGGTLLCARPLPVLPCVHRSAVRVFVAWVWVAAMQAMASAMVRTTSAALPVVMTPSAAGVAPSARTWWADLLVIPGCQFMVPYALLCAYAAVTVSATSRSVASFVEATSTQAVLLRRAGVCVRRAMLSRIETAAAVYQNALSLCYFVHTHVAVPPLPANHSTATVPPPGVQRGYSRKFAAASSSSCRKYRAMSCMKGGNTTGGRNRGFKPPNPASVTAVRAVRAPPGAVALSRMAADARGGADLLDAVRRWWGGHPCRRLAPVGHTDRGTPLTAGNWTFAPQPPDVSEEPEALEVALAKESELPWLHRRAWPGGVATNSSGAVPAVAAAGAVVVVLRAAVAVAVGLLPPRRRMHWCSDSNGMRPAYSSAKLMWWRDFKIRKAPTR